MLLLAGTLDAFVYSGLDLGMFPFPLIDELQAAKLSGALLRPAASPFVFCTEPGRRGAGGQGDPAQC